MKGLINDMLRLTNNISTIEDDKENIKKPVNCKTNVSDNIRGRQSNNRLVYLNIYILNVRTESAFKRF